jgi:hypothetical protein
MLLVISIYILAFGLSLMRYPRFSGTGETHVPPAFHPSAILIGVLMIGLAIWSGRRPG